MKLDHWTFLYVPAGEGGVRTMHVSKRLVAILGGLVGLLVILASLITFSFVRQSLVLHDATKREREVVALRDKIAKLESMVDSYESQMDQNLELLERANVMAGLGPLDDNVVQMGVGGHEPPPDPVLDSIQPLSRQRVLEIQDQVDKLLRQARFQRDSYEDVLDVLQDDQVARDTTPSIRPLTRGYLSSRYGRRIDPFTSKPAFHRGLDFSAPIGTPVFATAAGKIIRAARRGSLGNMVEVDHGNGTITRYGHLSSYAVKKGARVERGDIVGHVGNSGRSTAPHLHYEVVQNGKSANPWLYVIRD